MINERRLSRFTDCYRFAETTRLEKLAVFAFPELQFGTVTMPNGFSNADAVGFTSKRVG